MSGHDAGCREESRVLYDVVDYSEKALLELLYKTSRKILDGVHEPERTSRIRYFIKYFSDLDARTIIYEPNYIDHDFIEDFAAYYVTCFYPYANVCSRLHFFDKHFIKEDFQALLEGEKSLIAPDDLQSHYLGFIVVKPLPVAVVGKTCLKTYPHDGNRRFFPISRTYDANVFGIPLEVNTLAFQQQDSVVSACASSALWAVFQGTGKLFHHPIPSPVEITRMALANPQSEERILPNKGLYSVEIASAIRGVGLESFPIEVQDEYRFKGNLYSYLKGKIPLLMVLSLEGVMTPDVHYSIGDHAVAVTGYSLGKETPSPDPENGFLLRASRIDKVYAHDDQIGPHARMEFKGEYKETIGTQHTNFSRPYLTTSWIGSLPHTPGVRAEPYLILVPLYHKIRISFEDIYYLTNVFDDFIETKKIRKVAGLGARFEWDIFLTTVNDLKKDIHGCNLFKTESRVDGPAYRREVLLFSMPKFVWRAIARHKGRRVIELLFDATDVEQGRLFLRPIEYDAELSIVIRTRAHERKGNTLRVEPVWRILEWFRNQPEP